MDGSGVVVVVVFVEYVVGVEVLFLVCWCCRSIEMFDGVNVREHLTG